MVSGKLPAKVANPLGLEAQYRVVSNITFRTAGNLERVTPGQRDLGPIHQFLRPLYVPLPLPIIENLQPDERGGLFPNQVAPLASPGWISNVSHGFELRQEDHLPLTCTPGYVVRTGDRRDYLSTVYNGLTGIEAAFDDELQGAPGTNLVQVDNQGFSHHVDTLTPNQAGNDIYLTISLPIQQVAGKCPDGKVGKGWCALAVVVMDVHIARNMDWRWRRRQPMTLQHFRAGGVAVTNGTVERSQA